MSRTPEQVVYGQKSEDPVLEVRKSTLLEKIKGLSIPPHWPSLPPKDRRDFPYSHCKGGIPNGLRIVEQLEIREDKTVVIIFAQTYCNQMHWRMDPWYIAEGEEARGWIRRKPKVRTPL